MIRRRDLYEDFSDEEIAAAVNSGPGFKLPPLCTVCHRQIEMVDARWVHRWPLPGADHPATPPED